MGEGGLDHPCTPAFFVSDSYSLPQNEKGSPPLLTGVAVVIRGESLSLENPEPWGIAWLFLVRVKKKKKRSKKNKTEKLLLYQSTISSPQSVPGLVLTTVQLLNVQLLVGTGPFPLGPE